MSHFYPTTVAKDFPAEVIAEARMKILRPLQNLYQSCLELQSVGKTQELTCILRCILEMPVTPEYAALVGWFSLNGLIPAPTLYLYLNQLLSRRETYEGEKCCVAFAQEVLLFGYKYSSFLESVATIPGFCFRHPDMFIAINQTLDSPVTVEPYVARNRFSIPSVERKISVPAFPRFNLLPIVRSQNEPPMKQTIEECAQACYSMPEENRRHYLISFVLNTQIPDSVRDVPKILLEAVCAYAKHLLFNAIRDSKGRIGWERYNYHIQLHQIGMWIGLLSISRGPPPPLYYIDMHKTLRESVKLGCFHEVVILLAGYFSRACAVYALPCPYTTSILEIMAAVVNHPGIRLDILQAVDAFAEMIGTNISFFYKRKIDIDPSSFDMHSVFQMDHDRKMFFIAPYKPDVVVDNSPERVFNFFNSTPSVESLPVLLKDTLTRAEHVYKYYFTGRASSFHLPKELGESRQKIIDATMSMAMSPNPVLASTASHILTKLLVPPFTLDNFRLRYAFPNRDIFLACLHANCINPREINDIYCDILSNPQTGVIALPLVQRMMNHIFRLQRAHPEASFTALYALSGMQPPLDDPRLPTPDHAHIPLLRYFINFCKTGTEASRHEFISRFTPGTHQQVTALVQIVLGSVNEDAPDYTAIDCYAAMIPMLPPKILNEALLTGLLKAYELLTPTIVVAHQSAVFRVAYETFTAITDLNPIRLIPFFTHFAPGEIPGFAGCWMQLVLHPHILPALITSSDPTAIAFCLRFVIAIIKLAVNMPESFYRPVMRTIFTLADSFPLFVTAYHCLFLEHVPPRFAQLRNAILSATPYVNPKLPPPIGVYTGDSQEIKNLKLKAEPFITDKQIQSIPETVKSITDIIKKLVTTDSSIVWRFVFFCVAAYSQTHEKFSSKDVIVDLFIGLVEASPVFYSALMDHVRYQNTHTRFVVELLYTIFCRISSEQREIFLIEMFRRILCVTQPPASLRNLFLKIWEDKQKEIKDFMSLRGELKYLEEVIRSIKVLPGYTIGI